MVLKLKDRVMKIRAVSKVQFVKYEILEMIKTNKINGNKLPTEDELTKRLQVSLATLREALLELNKEGIISKRHGLGNFIHKSTLETKMRIDRFTDFTDLLQDGGYVPSSTYFGTHLAVPDSESAKDLNIPKDSKIVMCERLFFADGKAAIYAQNRIPYSWFVKEPTAEGQSNLTSYIEEYCGQKMTHGIQEITPILAKKKDQQLFGITEGSPIIFWKEIFYTLEDMPICLSNVKFNPEIIKMKMLWKHGQKC